MNGCKHSIDTVKMPNTPWHVSWFGWLIVSHLHQGFSLCCTIIFTSRGFISHVVISSVLVWTRDARKRTSPEVCIPTATCHFSHCGHKSSLRGRKSAQSQDYDTTCKLFPCLFDLVAYWTLAEQVSCSADFKRNNKSAFAAALLYLHLTETPPAGCVSNSFNGFIVYFFFILL